MSNVRDYLRRKAGRDQENIPNYGALIHLHRLSVMSRVLLTAAVFVCIGFAAYNGYQKQVFTNYNVISAFPKEQFDSSIHQSYAAGFLTYSNDGISYTDAKGNAMWNKTYEMQDPMVRVQGTHVAVADYSGHIVYSINENGDSVEIDTNLPIRELSVSANGMTAVVLEDGAVTWIYLYNSLGENVAYLKTSMAKSGYPLAITLSPNGMLLGVSYLLVESGAMKSSVAFYNFSSVGQNFVDNFASGADFADAVVPYLSYMNDDTAFAVADDRLIFFTGDQRPRNTAVEFLEEEIQGVYHSENRVGLVFLNTSDKGKYRLDLYGIDGHISQSVYFDIDYKDIIIWKDNILIYSETECMLAGKGELTRFQGGFQKPYMLVTPISLSRYVGVSKESIDTFELK